jgi:hypothetical protein
VKKTYHHIVNRDEETATASIEQFAKSNGQLLLPLLELITQARVAVDEVINSIGRKTIETILTLSAEHVAGAQTPGKISADIRWYGSQNGRVVLADRQLKVKRPRFRHKHEGEVKVPANEALQENGATAQRMMGRSCAAFPPASTRKFCRRWPRRPAYLAAASAARRSKTALKQLRQLRERRWDKADLLVIYIDWQRFGDHHVISGVGIDRGGSKHILGIEMGDTENAAAVKNLLTGLRDRGLRTDQQYLFVIDGAKALRAEIEAVFGSDPARTALPQSQDAERGHGRTMGGFRMVTHRKAFPRK